MIIGVVGLGTMGLGIAQVFAASGCTVLATDGFASARDNAHDRLRATLEPRVAKGAISAAAMASTLANLRVVEGPEALAPAQLVIEAVVENLATKQILFAVLEGVVAQDAVLATNTSSLSITTISHGFQVPERLLGLHFFNPAPAMKLVELIAHSGTNAGSIALARQLTEAAGKTVIACPDRPGFIVNRCARPFYGEALALMEEGRSASDIDAAMLAAGYKIGPLSLIDLIGADINLATTEGLQMAMRHPRYHVFDVLKLQVAAGKLGRKSGQGFVFPATPGPAPNDAAAIARRIEATLANEAAWLLSEAGTTGQGIDQAMKLGLNFPRGPFESAAIHGQTCIRTTLAALEAAAPAHLKTRYQTAPGS